MIITKILGLSTFFTKSKKAHMAILAIEMAVLAYAIMNQKKGKKENMKQKQKLLTQ